MDEQTIETIRDALTEVKGLARTLDQVKHYKGETYYQDKISRIDAALEDLSQAPALEVVPDAFYPDGVVDGEGIRVDGRRIGSKVLGQTSWIILPEGWVLMRTASARGQEVGDGVLEALKLAYRKHHLGDDSIGWSELSDTMLNALCEAMGDREYLAWSAQYGQEGAGRG